MYITVTVYSISQYLEDLIPQKSHHTVSLICSSFLHSGPNIVKILNLSSTTFARQRNRPVCPGSLPRRHRCRHFCHYLCHLLCHHLCHLLHNLWNRGGRRGIHPRISQHSLKILTDICSQVHLPSFMMIADVSLHTVHPRCMQSGKRIGFISEWSVAH